jgi:hypothetical protein
MKGGPTKYLALLLRGARNETSTIWSVVFSPSRLLTPLPPILLRRLFRLRRRTPTSTIICPIPMIYLNYTLLHRPNPPPLPLNPLLQLPHHPTIFLSSATNSSLLISFLSTSSTSPSSSSSSNSFLGLGFGPYPAISRNVSHTHVPPFRIVRCSQSLGAKVGLLSSRSSMSSRKVSWG